jgi:hypothetical protein
VSESVNGNTYYVDFERIRKHGGHAYFWYLTDYLKPTPSGALSDKTYIEGDCNKFRYKWLSVSFHKEPMGRGTGVSLTLPEKYKDWVYPPPNTVLETVLKSVCAYAK